MPDVICMGEVLVEFVANNHDDANVSLEHVTHWTCGAGGAPANVAVGIQRLGVLHSSFLGCVGQKDAFGVKLKEILQAEKVDTSLLLEKNDKDDKTTLVFVGGRLKDELCFYRGADRWIPPDKITRSIFDRGGVRCFHYGSITLMDEPGASAQHKAMQLAREQGLFLTYDPNYRPTLWTDKDDVARRVMLDAFQYAHMAKISQEEFQVATGQDDLQSAIQAVLSQGVELVVITRGDAGALAATRQFQVQSPPPPALMNRMEVVETTGAGDAFMAAMITKLLPEFERGNGSLAQIDKDTVRAALDYANIVGGLTCTRVGAIPALPTLQEVERLERRQRQTTASSQEAAQEYQWMAGMIDHTFLKPNCSNGPNNDDMEKLCREARQYGFAMVAVNPSQVRKCSRLLQGCNVRVGAAIGFPLGQTTSDTKAFETRQAIENGATEIDMVMNVRELQSGNDEFVQSEVETIVQICSDMGCALGKKIMCKVILETCYLSTDQKVRACEICRDAGADFVKTSTGFGPQGATVEDVKLMRNTVGEAVGVKASGGIRDLATARAMIAAGATRIGTSNGVAIMEELYAEEGNKGHE